MQLTVTMQLSRPVAAVRQPALARPVRAFSGSSSYLGARMQRSKALGLPQLPSRRCRSGSAGQPVRASFFGVGAPEAIVVGVVALVVFGPKGLAQAAKSVGSTLRSFAPTIREITSVSQELKSTLEQEIGLNEIKEEFNRPPTPRPALKSTDEEQPPQPQQQGAALSELADTMAASGQRLDDATSALLDPEIEKKRAASAAAAWGSTAPSLTAAPAVGAAGTAAEAGAAAAAAAAAPTAGRAVVDAPSAVPAVEAMSLDELEAELARRKAAVDRGQLPKQLSADDA